MNLAGEVRDLSFIDIVNADKAATDRVREIRCEPEVRRNMYTDHIISPDEHERFLNRLRSSDDTALYVVVLRGEVVGAAGYSALNPKHRRADWAFYLTTGVQGRGIGSALEFAFLDKVFAEQPIEKLNCEVIAFNAGVVKLHKRFGFVEEGIRRNHVVRDGGVHDVVLLGITREEWSAARSALIERLFAGL